MRILIIDDEQRIQTFLCRALEAEGHSVETLGDGAQAVPRAAMGEPDLVILDLLLPGRSGLDVLAELQRTRPDLPVMILSARAELAVRLRAFELGAVDFLAKPFSLDELLARSRVHLRRLAPAARGSVLELGRLTLELAERRAWIDGRVAELSDREFRLLRFLVEHAGQVVSRERLLAEVWGYDFDPRSNVVDVCVRRLRRRLGPQTPIQTVRNVGYRAAA